MANTKWSEFAPSEAVSAIGRVAGEFGIDPAYLMGLAKMETRVGSKSIRNGDDDTRNLFNIKDFSGGGIRAVDKAEGSNDAYRQYASYDESARDLVSLLERKFPAALEAKNPAEFAAALKKGGYATDPDYAGKLASVIEGASGAVKPAVNWDDFKPTGEAAGTDVNWDDFKPVAEQPVKPPEKPGAISSAIDSIGSGMNAVRDFATGAKPKRSSVLEGMQVPDLPFDAQEAERLSSRAYAERTPIPGAPKRVFPTMRPSTGPDRISTATSLGESVQDMPSLVRALAKAGSGILQGVGGVARAVGDVTGLDSLARGGALTAKQGGEFEKALGETGPIEGFGPKSPAPYLVDMAEGAASSLAQSAALATAFGPGAVIPLMSVQTAGQEYDKARTQGLDPAMALAGAIPKGIFEAVGEKFTGLDKVAGAMGTLLQKGASDAAKRTAGEVLIRSGIREIPGEVITYLGQTGTDLIPGIGLKQDLTMREFVDGLRDTVVQAGMMGGAMAGGGHAVHTKAPAATPSTQDLIGKHWGDGFTAQPKPDPIAAISSAATVDEAIVAATAAVESQPNLAGGQPTPAPAATVNPEIEQLNQRIAELENLNARQTTAPVEPTPDAIPAPAPASTEQLPGPNGAQSGQTDPAQPGQAALNEQAPPQAASEAGPAPAPAAGRVEATVPATTRAEAGAGELEAAGLTTPQRPPASWVIREKATGTVIMETFDPKKVQALNTQKYEAVPITEHLSGMSQRYALPVTTLKADGTLSIQGDIAAIKAKLSESGLTGIRTRDGVQVGKSQASKAQSIFQQETPVSQSVQAVTAIKDVAQTGPQQLGRDNRPLTEGGKPFKTRLAAAEAKKLQPMMRVVSVEGGFALADKTPKQLAAEQKAARRLRNPQTSAPGEPIPAHAFIAAEGGLHADTKPDMNVGGNPRIGNRMLFGGAGKGLSMERATARLIEEGYLDEGASHSQAMALIKRSLTQPQYNADGYERIAEAESQARFDDYLQVENETTSDPFALDDSDLLEPIGYMEESRENQKAFDALIAAADAEGIDTESILLDAHEATPDGTTDDYQKLATSRIEDARKLSQKAIARASSEQGRPAAEPEGAGYGREISGAQGAKDAANQVDPATQATAILDAAKVTGKERIDVLKDIKRGDVTPEELQAAYPAKVEGLTAPSKQDILDQQQRAEAAAKSEKAQQRAADELARRERERKDIAKASEAAADTFTLGGDAEQNLSGQGGMFDEAAPAPAAKAGAKPTSDNPTRPIKTGDVLRKNGHDYTVVEVWGNLVDAERVIEKGNGLTRKEGIALTAVEAMEAREAGNAAMGSDRAAHVGAASGRQGMFDAPEPKPERKIQQTDTPAFKAWFGDSKAVDANGKPLVVYHGTPNGGFSTFDMAKAGTRAGFESSKLGMFFSSQPRYANAMARDLNETGPTVYPVYLKLENPLRVFSTEADSAAETAQMMADAKAGGHDGVIDEYGNFVVFKPEQIKSAIGNDGRFNSANPDIRFSRTAERQISDARLVATDQLVDELKKNWVRAPEIIVARNMQDGQIPQRVRDYDAQLKSQGSDGEARGFIYLGKVYLLSDQLRTPEHIAEVLFHEVLGHYGLRGVFGDKLNPILNEMGTLRRPQVVAKAKEYGLVSDGINLKTATDKQVWEAMSRQDRLSAAEEVLAELAQTTPNVGHVQRAIAAIRTWLRENIPMLKSMDLSDAEIIARFILPARDFVTRKNETVEQAVDRSMRAAFSFAGEKAETADTHALDTAKTRLDAGENAEKVRQDTGWSKGADGKWRFEISDKDAALKPAIKSLYTGGHEAKPIESVTYRKNADGTYDLHLNPPNPQKTTDFVSLHNVSRAVVDAVLPESMRDSVLRGEGHDDYIGNFEDAKRITGDFKFDGFNALPLDEALNHPALFAAYPSLKDVLVQVDPKMGNGGAFVMMDNGQNIIRIGRGEQLSTLLHEVQHGIQDIESFAKGGSPGELAKSLPDPQAVNDAQVLQAIIRRGVSPEDAPAEFLNMLGRDSAPEARHMMWQDSKKLLTMDAGEMYKRLAGEVEARNTQARQSMSDAERRATSPESTADVPAKDVIVTFNGKEMQNAPMPENAKPADDSNEYHGDHRPPTIESGGARLDDLTKAYPEDIYGPDAMQNYGAGSNDAMDRATLKLLKSLRGRPDADVTVYRAVPLAADAQITAGDWVAINRDYANDHGEATIEGGYKVIKKTVKARELITNGDSIQEAGYSPNEPTEPNSGDTAMFARGQSAGPGLFQPTIWNTPEPTRTDRIIHKLQDGRVDLKRVQEAIKESGQAIEEKFDARLAETLYPGRVAYRSQQFLAVEVHPLLQSMALNKVTMNELADYLHARGAEERNVQVAKVNPAMPDGGAGTNTQGTLLTTQAARDYLANIPATRLAALVATARKVDAITAGTRQLMVSEGLEKQETIDAWQAAYKNYVPMFRDEADGMPPHPQGAGFTVKGSASKRATGSTKEVTNILAHVLMQREAAITRAEKNRVALSLYGLALSSPNPEFWTTIKPGMSNVQIGAELVAMGVDPLTAQVGMEGVPTIRTVDPVTNKVVDRANPMYKILPGAITMKLAGEDRVLMINTKNERGLRMAENLKNLDGLTNLDLAGSIIGKSTRWIASVNTQYNPAFGVVNLVRDTLGGAIHLSNTELRGKSMEVLGHVPAAMTGIARELAKPGQTGQWQKLYREFQEDGGQTGFKENFRDPNHRAKAIEKELASLGKSKLSPGKAAHAVLDLLDGFNTSMENAVRLSSYKTALDQGISRAEAARLARELTVDFNRKGVAGREMGPLYAFFNASVQGNARTWQAIKGPGGRKIVLGGLSLGMLQALMLLAAGYDDDEIPEFVKTRALIIPLFGKEKKFVSIPYPLGLHVLPNTGRVMAELMLNGGKDIGKRAFDAVGEIAGAMNPLGGGNVFTADGALKTLAPTVIDPFIELTANKNFSGNQIERKPFNEEGDNRPGYARARESTQRSTTGQVYLGISKAINKLTGGSAYEAGLASPTAERVRYLGQVVGGGVLREMEKTIDGSVKAANGEAVKPSAIPMFSRFYGEVDKDSVEMSRYYEARHKMDKAQSSLKAAEKAGDMKAYTKLLRENPGVVAYGDLQKVQKSISELNKLAIETVENPAKMKKIDTLRTEQMSVMNKLLKKMEKGEPTLADRLRPGEAATP